jgi:hypothetical protein
MAEPGEFFVYGEPGNFPLRVRAQRSEDNFLVEASDEFRAEEFAEFGRHGPLQRGERKPSRAQKLLRADVAGAELQTIQTP